MLIMDCDGIILDINRAFTHNFGHTKEELTGRNFSMLFTENDRKENKPARELKTVMLKGQATDENFVVNKEGVAVWAIGESVLVSDANGRKYIVKDIVNLQAKKQLQLFLIETEELLERIFASSRDVPMMILDARMKIVKANTAFLNLFESNAAPDPGTPLSALDHPFWSNPDIKKEISNIIVKNESLKRREVSLETKGGEKKKIKLDSRTIEGQPGQDKKIFIMVEEVV